MSIYFAYGSNMDPLHMSKRVPGAQAIGPGRLEGFRLVFNVYSSDWDGGAANLELDERAHAWGVLWDVPAEQESGLDAYQGHPTFFRREEVAVLGPPGRVIACACRVAHQGGLVFPSSEIYGGLRASWDYGPLGVELKNNVKRAWWRSMVQTRDDVVGLDAAIIMSPRVWEASGHVASFSDPLVECMNCHQRFRADHLPGYHSPQSGHETDETTVDMAERPVCPNCGNERFTEPKNFNLMFKTHMGPVEEEAAVVYLRP